MSTPTLEQLREWIGRSETRTETLAAEPVHALAATFDLDGNAIAAQPLPPLWHWLYFLPRAPQHTGPGRPSGAGRISAAGAAAAPHVGRRRVELPARPARR